MKNYHYLREVGTKIIGRPPKRVFNHTSFLFKIAFNLFEAFGPIRLDFLLKLLR